MTRRIVISGASRGLGSALARALAAPGTDLLLLARTASELSQVAESCRAQGASVIAQCLDMRDRAAVHPVVAAFAAKAEIHLLIANAGVLSLEAWPDDDGPDWRELHRQFNDNLACTLSLLEAGLSLPIHQRRDLHLVVISSLNALFPVAEAPGYCMAKAAQRALIQSLEDYYACRKHRRTQIRFTTVFPGFIATGMANGYPGRRPWQCSPEQAAQRIVRGLKQRKRIIVFPRRLALLVFLARALPSRWVRPLISAQRAFTAPSP